MSEAIEAVLTTFLVAASVIIFVFFGWKIGHDEVAEDCRKLGAFYVGKSVFECREKK